MRRNSLPILLFIMLFADALLLNAQPYDQRASKKTYQDIPLSRKKGSGPRYWIAYEYCWVNNKPIPEERWKKNIDWVNDNFKAFGYDMVSNDGWIEGAQTLNENGFITKYNSNWQFGFDYWAKYIADKGMKMGVYYNPLWLTKTAYHNNLPVKGTNYTSRDITGPVSFNSELYWVDVDRPGAKEWIQGYIRYFKEMGVNFLRIDFLENYENNYGLEKYNKALRWMREAADSTMMLSLVMPNCFNHGTTELKYGDMIRISDDCFNGGWEFTSGRRRGQSKHNWPQFANAFDGFVSFADIGGRDQMVRDGDFTRINTLLTENEKKFQISLLAMTGSPIAIADQFNTIGNDAWLYQNEELLSLNDEGFAGKPISYDINDAANSSRWIGQMPNGDWVIGLFNREETEQERGIDFVKELGLKKDGKYQVRDLWLHKELGGYSNTFSVKLLPHECRVIRITTNSSKYEAEVASLINGSKKQSDEEKASGIGYVNMKKDSSTVLIAVDVAKPKVYRLRVNYKNEDDSGSTSRIEIKSNDRSISLAPGSHPDWKLMNCDMYLEAGTNYIYITRYGKNGVDFKVDYIEIR